MVTSLPRIALVVLVLASCGKGGSKDNAKRDSGLTGPVAAPISLPVLGVDRITRFSFIYDAGSAAYKKASEAAGKKDWAEARKQAEAALAKDPNHLDARWLLGVALVQTGDPAAAADHLAAPIAADYYKYGANLSATAELKDFFTSQHGQAILQLAGQIEDEYARRIKGGLWLVGRRASFKWPEKSGTQPGTSRGELYAFDRDNKRYLRLTHTSDQVVGFVRSKSGSEAAILGFDRIDRPAGADAPPLVARAWLQAFDTTTWKNTTPKITFGPARAISIYYGDGDQLLVATAPATGRWTLGDWTMQSVDRTTGKLTKVAAQLGAPRIELTLDEGRIVPPRSIEGVQAAWTGDPPRAPTLQLAGAPPIQIPESGQAAMETVSVAPGRGYIAFATAVDPCAKDTAPSLYVANGKTGALKHLLTNRSRFATRWLDPTTLAYEDGDGAIRLWDATTQREALRVDNKAGVALEVLSLASAPLCKHAPPVVEPAGAGDEPPLPPEESAGEQPVTKPQ